MALAALQKNKTTVLATVLELLALLGSKAEWDLDDNFTVTETLAGLAAACGLPAASGQDDAALEFWQDVATEWPAVPAAMVELTHYVGSGYQARVIDPDDFNGPPLAETEIHDKGYQALDALRVMLGEHADSVRWPTGKYAKAVHAEREPE